MAREEGTAVRQRVAPDSGTGDDGQAPSKPRRKQAATQPAWRIAAQQTAKEQKVRGPPVLASPRHASEWCRTLQQAREALKSQAAAKAAKREALKLQARIRREKGDRAREATTARGRRAQAAFEAKEAVRLASGDTSAPRQQAWA